MAITIKLGGQFYGLANLPIKTIAFEFASLIAKIKGRFALK